MHKILRGKLKEHCWEFLNNGDLGMKIGVITYYKAMNFGATLQAVSTYCYLKNHGHEPIFINYIRKETQEAIAKGKGDPQWKAQLDFVNGIITNQTSICETAQEVLQIVKEKHIQGIIVGSDALLQHHPLLSRLHKGRRKPFYVSHVASDRMFPNLFWGCGVADKIPMALMSVSSQNSAYQYFMPWTKKAMCKSLSKMRYISVRDTWTQNMLKVVLHKIEPITPDPVFAFNQNAGAFIPTKASILERFHLPKKYVLLSLFTQVLSKNQITELKEMFEHDGIALAVLPMPTGQAYEHDVRHDIRFPLSPIDWYALIKYSQGYIGSNMHPIVVSLHNAVPCFSLDNWGRVNFKGEKVDDGSSKIQHIMEVFGVSRNHRMINRGSCDVTMQEIYEGIKNFPKENIQKKAVLYLQEYNEMMKMIINKLS